MIRRMVAACLVLTLLSGAYSSCEAEGVPDGGMATGNPALPKPADRKRRPAIEMKVWWEPGSRKETLRIFWVVDDTDGEARVKYSPWVRRVDIWQKGAGLVVGNNGSQGTLNCAIYLHGSGGRREVARNSTSSQWQNIECAFYPVGGAKEVS